ncbi:hypothetical protein TanjilG_17423 [Lupinus angustifolius]|uniref:Uncharacterized protein n=1 Tax=Lupinus angustifolius TaxID=3871 RepID=A0A4P1R1F0_LUPAN|nr:hypothetical protein TanjilG_17423 [Lupinus angustifolius]
MKAAAVFRNSQENLLQVPLCTRSYNAESSLEKDTSTADLNASERFRSHGMLAPFTAGWQTTDLNPLVIDKSEGSYVYDINGKKYLDSLAGLWCTALEMMASFTHVLIFSMKVSLDARVGLPVSDQEITKFMETYSPLVGGGNEPRLVEAAITQLKKLPFYHSFWNRTTKPSLDLAKDLLETFTARKMAKAFFVNSGSEANDSQVKLVWYYNNALGRPNKKKFIARAKSYHGSTLIAASLSGLPALHQKFDLPAPFVLHTDCPHYWRYHLPGETEEEFSTRLANNLEELILKEGPDTIAAFIAEPVMGAGGVITPPSTYFEKIQAVVKKYDILFIADEYVLAIKYDIMIISDLHRERNILDKVRKISPKFQDGIKAFSDSPIIGEIRGTGLILGTEFTDNKSPNDPFPPEWGNLHVATNCIFPYFNNDISLHGIGAYFGAQCEKRGMLVRVAGDNIMMCPPFIISPEEIDELISIYGKALKATEERVNELKSQKK